MFKAVVVDKQECSVRQLSKVDLPSEAVRVKIDHSTLNYKDALAITGTGRIVRSFPMVPGIDFAGTVEESADDRWKAGDKVILNGWGVGEGHWGGLAEYACVKPEWLIALPEGITTRQAMAMGTAGYTAMLCVMALQRHGVTPDKGEVLVTGASGGVGSVSVAVLSKLGYSVAAMTGKSSHDYLTRLGATEIVARDAYSEPGKPLARERWSGVIDTAGGHILANACASTRYGGVVAACGMAQSLDFPASVAPFILRGVTLAGIDSVQCDVATREEAWARLVKEFDWSLLDGMVSEISLDDVPTAARSLIEGTSVGRIVVDVNASS